MNNGWKRVRRMRRHLGTLLILFAVVFAGSASLKGEDAAKHPLAGADESTLSRSHEGNPKIPHGEFSSEVWVTAYPVPYFSKQLILEEP